MGLCGATVTQPSDNDHEDAAWLYLEAHGTFVTPEVLLMTTYYIKTERPEFTQALLDRLENAKDFVFSST